MSGGDSSRNPQAAAAALEVKRRVEGQLLAIPGVESVGFGAKTTAEEPTGEFAIRVYVRRKLPLADVAPAERIPEEIDGVKVDVVLWNDVVPQATLEGGLDIRADHNSAGLIYPKRGTLGCLALTVAGPPRTVVLSAEHVLYGENAGEGATGDRVYLTSCSDCCETHIATVATGINNTRIDAAIATLTEGHTTHARVHGVPLTGTRNLQDPAGLEPATITALANRTYQVSKYGGRTSLTRGVITDLDASTLGKTGQIGVQANRGRDRFSKKGDSGSVIYDNARKVVALLWAGTDDEINTPPFETFGCPINLVEAALGITVMRNHPAVAYRVGPMGVATTSRIYADLGQAGATAPLVALADTHRGEVQELLRTSRRATVAWHRNHGPSMVRALLDVAEGRSRQVPAALVDVPWDECVQRVAAALAVEGSESLRADLAHWAPMLASLGGRTYDDAVRMVVATARSQPSSTAVRG